MQQSTQRPTVVLKPERGKPVVQGHPWLFSGAIQRIAPEAVDGEIVTVVDSAGKYLATGYLNRRSQIQVRLLSWQPGEEIDETFWRRRLAAALALRQSLPGLAETTAYRLVNAESDYLPGLTVDLYGEFLVLQAGTLAVDRRKGLLAELLLELTGGARRGGAQRDGHPQTGRAGAGHGHPRRRAAAGTARGARVRRRILCRLTPRPEDRLLRRPTGQSAARRRLLRRQDRAERLQLHRRVRRLRPARGARHVVNIDSSFDALAQAEANLRGNGFDPDAQSEQIAGDVFAVLRDWQSTADEHGCEVAILDPPKFAQNQQSLERALRGYKEINRLALRLLRPGGILATFSCSGLVDASLFQKVVFGAALDAGRPVQVLEWLRQSPDHPVAITFPEGEYLKGLICRVL